MNKTNIPWADYSWTPVTGCSKISEGCKNCYAHALAGRFNKGDFSVRFHYDRMDQPQKVKKPSRIFVCSTADLFHQNVDWKWTGEIFSKMIGLPRHTFIVLTKRPAVMREFLIAWDSTAKRHGLRGRSNIWLGVTTENQERFDERWPILADIEAKVRFVSAEPLLGPLVASVNLCAQPDWIIAGPETGPGRRACRDWWIDHLEMRSANHDIPFFDKRKNAQTRQWPKV